ncbi:MAG: heme ABC transporter permease [Xanthobacteraceae bacterium]
MRISELANPNRFQRLARWMIPLFAALTVGLLATGLYLGFQAPAERDQGITARIMFVHVPSAWLALGIYTMMAIAALGTLVWRHPLADVAQKAAAPIGAAFALVCLVTGSVWGRPTWGTYWEWDGRLTSMLVLFLLYLGIMALWRAFDEPLQAAKAVAILTLVGFINIPIVKFSVDWWSTLHQPASVFRLGGPTMHSSYLSPLLICALGFSFLFAAMLTAAMRNELLRRRVRTLTIFAANEAR